LAFFMGFWGPAGDASSSVSLRRQLRVARRKNAGPPPTRHPPTPLASVPQLALLRSSAPSFPVARLVLGTACSTAKHELHRARTERAGRPTRSSSLRYGDTPTTAFL
jgi:hypothetical protein